MDNENTQQQPAPLSKEQIQQIRERVSTAVYRKHVHEQRADGSVSEMYTVVYVAQAAHDMMRLLNEVERLRSEVAELHSEAIDLRLTIQDAYWKWEHGTGLDGEWARQARESLSGEDEEESEGSTNDN